MARSHKENRSHHEEGLQIRNTFHNDYGNNIAFSWQLLFRSYLTDGHGAVATSYLHDHDALLSLLQTSSVGGEELHFAVVGQDTADAQIHLLQTGHHLRHFIQLFLSRIAVVCAVGVIVQDIDIQSPGFDHQTIIVLGSVNGVQGCRQLQQRIA